MVVVVGIVVDLSVFSEIISEERKLEDGGQKSWKYFCLGAFENLMAFYDN